MGGPIRKKLSERLRNKLIAEAVKAGASETDAREAVEDVASERPLLDWLMNGGFEQLLALVLKLIALFASEKK